MGAAHLGGIFTVRVVHDILFAGGIESRGAYAEPGFDGRRWNCGPERHGWNGNCKWHGFREEADRGIAEIHVVSGLWKPLFRPIIGPMIAMSFVNGFAFAGMEQTYSLLVYKRVYEPQFGSLSPNDLQAAIDKACENAGFATGICFFMVGDDYRGGAGRP